MNRTPDNKDEFDARDKALVARFVEAGDEAAFAELMGRHEDRLRGFAFRFIHNRADAEEITQNVFISCHRNLKNFRGDCSVTTWLYRITLNHARNRHAYWRRRRRNGSVSLDAPLSEEGDATFADLVPASADDPAREATTGDFEMLIGRCMAQLPRKMREILTMRNVLDKPYEVIALELGINEGTVKSRIARARDNLRELLMAQAPEFKEGAKLVDFFDGARSTAHTLK